MKMVAMVRASKGPGLWSGRARLVANPLARPLLCTRMMLPGAQIAEAQRLAREWKPKK